MLIFKQLYYIELTLNKVDRQIIMPDSMQVKSSVNAFDLLGNMAIPRLMVDPVNQAIKMGAENVQLRINGIKASVQEVTSIRAKDILRVEYFEDPDVRFGNEEVAAVVNFIVDRDKSYGGYFSVDGRNAPFVGFQNNNLVFKTNYKASEFRLQHHLNYRNYDDRWADGNETLNFPGKSIERNQEGVKALMKYFFHVVDLTYNLTSPDNYVFNAAFKNNIYDYKNTSAYNNFYSDDKSKTFSKAEHKGYDYTPVVDLYFRKELKNKQSLAANLVGTYIIGSKNESDFFESEGAEVINSFFNNVEGKKYSIIGEMLYEKQFEKFTVTAGGKHTQGVADNVYTGTSDTKTTMKNADTYIFAQIQGKIASKLGYTVGMGGSRLWFKEGNKDATYHHLRPSVQLSYPLNDNLTLKYSFLVNTRTPSLGQLSDVTQQTDHYQINRGNPNLKPYNTYENKLSLNYSKEKFDISTTVMYLIFDKLFANTFGVEEDKIVSFWENHKKQTRLWGDLSITARIIKDVWTLNGWIGAQAATFEPLTGSKTSYSNMFGNISSNLLYKNYNLSVGYYARYNSLWGETINYGDKWSYIEAGYKYKEAKLALGMSLPFEKSWSRGSKNVSPVKPSTNWTYIGANGSMLYLRFSWNMSFGRKHNAGEKKLNNADSDKGTL